MKLTNSFLSQEERQIIHNDSIKILEEVGVKFPSEKALALLEKGGARIDWDKQIAYISEAMVKKALETAPQSVVLGARNPEYDFKMPSSYSACTLDGCGAFALDFETGKKRGSLLKDNIDAAKVFEEIDLATIYWPPVSGGDLPRESRSLIAATAAMKVCSKHVQDEVKTLAELPYLIGVLKAILGSEEEVKRRKIYSVIYCTIAPLCHDGEFLDANLELTNYEVPIVVYPMPGCGTTGPASLYSSLALGNAEGLSALVVFQLANPGTPIIFGNAQGVVNPRNGNFLEGAAEMGLLTGAAGDMARFYNLPNMSAGCLTDAKELGMQAVIEKVITTLPLVLGGVDAVQGIGLIETSMTLSLEQILIDHEIMHLCKRIKDGVDISPGKKYFEDIKAVGPGGHFLKQKNTRKAFRSDEFYVPELLERNSYDEWLDLGKPNMLQNARQKVEEILASEIKHPLSLNTEKEINEVLEEAKAKLEESEE